MSLWFRELKRVAAALALLALPAVAGAQVTTGSLAGTVTSDKGEPIPGATITVLNTRSGIRTTATTRSNGRYILSGLEPGGPYRIAARAIGFRPEVREGVAVKLGETVDVSFRLPEAPVQLEEIVTVSDPLQQTFNPSRQGAQSVQSDTVIARLPTLDRDLTDFAKLTPQVALRDGGGNGTEGLVALGQNNRFNTLQIDGSTVNDRFGLGRSGFAGGQAEGRPIGLLSVKEVQILLSPYDVRQGRFTGALLNTITKSGTNSVKVDAFFQYRSQDLAGPPLEATSFDNSQFGLAVGGPIVKDKVHFFLSGEARRATRPAAGPFIGSTDPAPIFTQAAVDSLYAVGASRYGLTPEQIGTADLINNDRPVTNLTGRFDFALSESNRLVLRYNYNYATNDIFSRSATGTIDLSTQGYFFKSQNHSVAGQLYSNFKSGAANELLVSAGITRDKRTPNVFLPAIIVQNFPPASGTGTYNYRFGAEQFSQGNELDQNLYELTDNFSFSAGDHRITVGTSNEYFDVRNLFAQSSYGVWQFDNLNDFRNGVVENYTVSAPLSENFPVNFRTGQLGFYVADAWSPSRTLSLNFGVRADIPYWLDQPVYAPEVIADFGPQEIPSGQFLISPRVGFNWDAQGTGMTQLRGGVGLFAGTPAYVWYSNFFQQSGTGLGILTCGVGTGRPSPAAPATFDAANPVLACGDGTTIAPGATLGEVNIVEPGTKYPQVLRANLALDRRLPNNFVLTFEGTFTKGINDIVTVNRNLAGPTGTDANGRVLYGTLNANGTTTTNYFNLTRYGPSNSAGVLELRNANSSYSWSGTVQLQKTFSKGLAGSVAYTYSEAYDAQSFTSSRGTSNWRFGRVNAGRDDEFGRTRSSFDRPHRILANATYTFPWKRWATDVTISYIGQSGQPYTLSATGTGGRGDLNRDGWNGNDPIYIPRNALDPNEITFVAQGSTTAQAQAQLFENYIASESCLAKQRGRIMERNSCRNPWQTFIDLTVRQTLPFGMNRVTLEAGIFNLANLIDSDWGKIKTVDGAEFYAPTALQVPATGGVVNGREAFQLTNNVNRADRFVSNTSPGNSWQLQFGARYSY